MTATQMTGNQYVYHSPYGELTGKGVAQAPSTQMFQTQQMLQQPRQQVVLQALPQQNFQQHAVAIAAPQFHMMKPVGSARNSLNIESEEDGSISSLSGASTPPMIATSQVEMCTCGCGQPAAVHQQQKQQQQLMLQQQVIQPMPQTVFQPGQQLQQMQQLPQMLVQQQPLLCTPQMMLSQATAVPQQETPAMTTTVPSTPSPSGPVSTTIKPVIKKIQKTGRKSPPPSSIRLIVRFKHGRQGAYTSQSLMPLGTHVIVRGDWGQDLGIVVGSCSPDPNESAPRKRSWVARIASNDELTQWKELLAAEESALNYMRQQCIQHNVPISIHRAEYQLDGAKLTFHYTTKVEHPDFRNILKDGYREFRCRIWLNNCIPSEGEKGDLLDLTSAPIPTISGATAVKLPSC
eukprot:TRINITY_DN24394_c0_g1_i1.p1 TRINITY_DN24394_c0_g1~~TRINITY_DN24394_c0_g1_i1.p1  ORF type:complete len:404 (+),score=83.83 TRINITY_DN24394_c0_g1_i1:59-1270(+)